MKSLRKMIALLIATVMTVGTVMPAFAASEPAKQITYNAGGAEGTVPGNSVADATGKVVIANRGDLAVTGKGFAGWLGTDDVTYWEGQEATIASDLTLTAQWKTYQITVENSNPNVNIVGETYTAYKLFENTYQGQVSEYGLDQSPHAYYIKKGSPFFEYDFTAGASNPYVTYDAATGTYAQATMPAGLDAAGQEAWQKAADDNALYQILKYFTLTDKPGEGNEELDEQLVIVEPIPGPDASGKQPGDDGYEFTSSFDAAKAYELADAMAPIIDRLDKAGSITNDWKATGTGVAGTNDGDPESAVIVTSSLGPGYYLVTGTGHPYKEDGTVDRSKTVTATVALTTTDPQAKIIAKLDAPKPKKEINDPGTPKYNNKGVGDTVPYVVSAAVPNLNGYEKYFFILSDSLSKGLTLNDYDLTENTTDGVISNAHFYVETGETEPTADDYYVYDNGFEVRFTWPSTTDTAKLPAGYQTAADGSYYLSLTRVTDYAKADDLNPDTVTVDSESVPYDPAVHGPVNDGTSNTMTYYVEDNGTNEDGSVNFEVVLHDFVQYKGYLIVDSDADPAWVEAHKNDNPPTYKEYDYRNVADGDKSKVGTYYSPFAGSTLKIYYSATVNEDAVINNPDGNVNTSKLIYSNQPDKHNGGKPGDNDKPGYEEGDEDVTTESPDSKTVTYSTGLVVKKVDEKSGNPLANAEFTLKGEGLKNLVKKSQVIYREMKPGETAVENQTKILYKLTDGGYTTEKPTPDKVYLYDTTTKTYASEPATNVTNNAPLPDYAKIVYGTWRQYDGFSTNGLTKTTVTLPQTDDDTSSTVTKELYLNQNDITTATNALKQYIEDTITDYGYQSYRLKLATDDSNVTTFRRNADGTFTEDANANPAYVAYDSSKWDEMTIAEKEAAVVTYVVTTDENGILQFEGLAATGEEGPFYELTETKAPEGYNILKQPIEIKIVWDPDDKLDQDETNVTGQEDGEYKIYYRTKADGQAITDGWEELTVKDAILENLIELKVNNNYGVELPSTGGTGTRMIYTLGGILVGLAGVMLVFRRRRA